MTYARAFIVLGSAGKTKLPCIFLLVSVWSSRHPRILPFLGHGFEPFGMKHMLTLKKS